MNFEVAKTTTMAIAGLKDAVADHKPAESEQEPNTPEERFDTMWSRVQALMDTHCSPDAAGMSISISVCAEDGSLIDLGFDARSTSSLSPGSRSITATWTGNRELLGDRPETLSDMTLKHASPEQETEILLTLCRLEESLTEVERVSRGEIPGATFFPVELAR